MLGRRIDDPVESRAGMVEGLGLLPVTVTFGADKRLGRPSGTEYGEVVHGYEIHHGIARLDEGATPWLGDGCRSDAVWGTSWHGSLENDGFRRAFLTEVASVAGADFAPAPGTCFAALREARLDMLGDLVADHLDIRAISSLIDNGVPPGLPILPR